MDWAMINTFVSAAGFGLVIMTGLIKLGGIEQTIRQHSAMLDKHEIMMLEMVKDLQRLIGRSESAAQAARSRHEAP